MSNKVPIKITAVEKNFFDKISVDSLNIHIGGKKIPISHEVGIYNQVLGHLKIKYKPLVEKLDIYLANKYDADLPLGNLFKAKWVDELVLGSAPNFFSKLFKIRRISSTTLELYAVNDGNVLEFICNSSMRMYNVIKERCQFWQEADDFCVKYNVQNPAFMTANQIQEDFKDALRGRLIEEVRDIKVLSNKHDEYCLAFYDLATGDPTQDTPAWDSFLAGMVNDSCRRAYMAWVYSAFVGDNFGRQALIVHGSGETGKTATANAIYNHFEMLNRDIVTTLEEEDNQDKFSAASYLRKRFVLGADSTDRSILRNKLLKNITGKDKVNVREMGKDKKSAQTYAKIMITTNQLPFIDLDRPEEVSRCLLISLIPENCVAAKRKWNEGDYGDWQTLLALEIDNFIAKCKPAYDEFLSGDGHNLLPYENYNEVLESGIFYIKRDVPVWWKHCVKHTGSPKDVIEIKEMYADYVRFISSEIRKVRRMEWMVKKQVLLYLRENGIEVPELDNFSVLYIKGYRFIHDNPDHRVTARQLIAQKFEEVANA